MTVAQPRADAILDALGGVANVDEIDPCTTRLRSIVKDPSLVDPALLRAAGAFGVMISGRVVQVVVGPHADTVATDLADLM
ncbi:PTS sugar transporter [Xylanimonas oleitrophica]|uniref:PTS sugar transporter n=1 Tax=Xylanimonas oleitrophica TaxID=2607479 RepID=A0A2W5XTM3_9MICO|nr:PTS transporter subunit EIIB [Xylanimonas oleitrophica]PZR53448.1 PTS sugar transporter [Xylanimonas oleitrophica]